MARCILHPGMLVALLASVGRSKGDRKEGFHAIGRQGSGFAGLEGGERLHRRWREVCRSRGSGFEKCTGVLPCAILWHRRLDRGGMIAAVDRVGVDPRLCGECGIQR